MIIIKKALLFEKKKQRTFICCGFGFSRWTQPDEQKFFGSFFQKRTFFLYSSSGSTPA
jgi:hypothetical protein